MLFGPQWLAVKKYGVPSSNVLFTSVPVHNPPPARILATDLISLDHGVPSGQITSMLQAPDSLTLAGYHPLMSL